MDQLYRTQLKQIIANMHEKNERIPFKNDLIEHPILGPSLKILSYDQKKELDVIVEEYIEHFVKGLQTKGGQLFRRLLENEPDNFREYRVLNQDKNNVHMPRFQHLSDFFQKELFELESVLTSKMLKRPDALDKVIDAFYTIVYAIFPLHGSEQ